MIALNDIVAVKAPFDTFYSGEYVVLSVSDDGVVSLGEGMDFSPEYLTLVENAEVIE